MTIAEQRTVSALHSAGLQAALDELSITDAVALLIDGTGVRDQRTLMEQIRSNIDLAGAGVDPPSGWDGLKDAMWSVVGAQQNDHVVLLWTGADTILGQSLAELLVAIEVFTLVARDARTRTTGVGAVRFQLVLVGDGPMFPPYNMFG
ncbi:MAG: hypothetical protein ABIQ39_15700 [Ilumatobacteraceae bacterium]